LELFYFTTAQHAISNLALRRLKVARFKDLNDPFELRAVNLDDRAIEKEFNAYIEELNSVRGLVCFTDTWKNPLMWSHYADKHAGICLGFEVADEVVRQVQYQKYLQRPTIRKKADIATYVERLIASKYEDWSYEREWRSVFMLNEATTEHGLHFLNFSDLLIPTKVILGARCQLPMRSLAHLLQGLKAQVFTVKIATNGFEMVLDRRGIAIAPGFGRGPTILPSPQIGDP